MMKLRGINSHVSESTCVLKSTKYMEVYKKWQPGALNLPHMQGPGRGPTILVDCTQPYPIFYTRGCFQDLNP